MYAQFEKKKENRGRMIDNSITQKNNGKQALGFVDNRLANVIQGYSQKERQHLPQVLLQKKEQIGSKSMKTEAALISTNLTPSP